MGIYDRDYERSYDTGSGWRDGAGFGGHGGVGAWTAGGKLIALMGAVYVAQLLLERPLAGAFSDLLSLPAEWWREPWRVYGFISYPLLHSTDGVFHLLFNALALYFFGQAVERRVGGREYVAFFFAAAAFAGLVWSGVETIADSGPRSPLLLGASGGIAGVLVLFALWYPHVQVYLMGLLPVPAWVMALLFIGQDIYGAIGRTGNVAYSAHLGGALFGYLYYRYGWRASDWLPAWAFGGGPGGASRRGGLGSMLKRRPNLRVHREAEEDDETEVTDDDRVDEILRKIQSHGQSSLTREERRILEQASRRYQQRRR